jgi:putative ABC transport system permease protein
VFAIEGRPTPLPGQLPVQSANDRFVSPDYFKTMQIPLISGRQFDERDTADAPKVVIINEKMARTFWTNDDPIGKRIHFGFGPLRPGQREFTIVGVVGDVKQMGLDLPRNPEAYFPLTQPLPGAAFANASG